MKYEDLYSFIMENIPEEEWKEFYDDTGSIYVNAMQSFIRNDKRKGDVFSITKGLVCIHYFDTDRKGEAWRKQFYKLFFDNYDLEEKNCVQNEQVFRSKMVDFLVSEYLCSVIRSGKYQAKTEEIASQLMGDMPENRRYYKGTRRNMAIHPEIWVYSAYDCDENMFKIVEKDKRFTKQIEKQIALDIVLSIRDFFKVYSFIGIERKVA